VAGIAGIGEVAGMGNENIGIILSVFAAIEY